MANQIITDVQDAIRASGQAVADGIDAYVTLVVNDVKDITPTQFSQVSELIDRGYQRLGTLLEIQHRAVSDAVGAWLPVAERVAADAVSVVEQAAGVVAEAQAKTAA